MNSVLFRRAALTLTLGLVGAVAASAHGSHGYHGYHGWGLHVHGPYLYGSWALAPYAWGQASYDPSYEGSGALDLDVSPERAEIYLDGRYVGKADDLDGFPTYLWLEQGTYDVVIYLPGFQTISRQYTVYPGAVIDVEDAMEPGDAIRPEDLQSASTERRDARVRRDEERRRDAAAQESQRDRYADGDWRERRSHSHAAEAVPRVEVPPSATTAPVTASGGRLRLTVEPADASVYLDGRFVGTGEELAALSAGLLVNEGEHRLETVRPGRASDRMRFEVGSGETVSLEVRLQPIEAPTGGE